MAKSPLGIVYHVHSIGNRIAAHDSMNASLRQRRKIVELLYHDDTSENRIERHDSMVPTLRQRMLRILLRSRCSLRCPFCLATRYACGAKRQRRTDCGTIIP